MKGQYRIVSEMLLILIGVLITGYVVTNFQNLRTSATGLTVQDNYNAVANDVIIGLLKASHTPSSIVRVEVPDRIVGGVYKITLDGNTVQVTNLEGTPAAVTRQIFNIDQVDRIVRSEVVSSSRVVEVVSEGGTIRIRRGT